MNKFKRLFLFIFFLMLLVGETQASITLKVTAVNPSSEKQMVPVKVYLPIEVKPEDIIYREDLDIVYDAQLGSYYVFKEYELEPQEVLEKEIEISDIWTIPFVEIESLRQEAKGLRASAEKTPVNKNINLICDSIDKKLGEITKMQTVPAVNPPQHISDYRYSLELLKLVKNDLVQARSLLAQLSARPTLVATVWKIIIFVIIFLAVLGLSFYIIWQRQAKLIKEITPAEPKEESVSPKESEGEGKTEEKKPAGSEDIEKIIREGK